MIATVNLSATTQSGNPVKVWFELDDNHDGVRIQLGTSEPIIVETADLVRVVRGLSNMEEPK